MADIIINNQPQPEAVYYLQKFMLYQTQSVTTYLLESISIYVSIFKCISIINPYVVLGTEILYGWTRQDSHILESLED